MGGGEALSVAVAQRDALVCLPPRCSRGGRRLRIRTSSGFIAEFRGVAPLPPLVEMNL